MKEFRMRMTTCMERYGLEKKCGMQYGNIKMKARGSIRFTITPAETLLAVYRRLLIGFAEEIAWRTHILRRKACICPQTL